MRTLLRGNPGVSSQDQAAAQVMMGADGAVHLDAIGDVPQTAPIIVQQQPELVGPSMIGPAA